MVNVYTDVNWGDMAIVVRDTAVLDVLKTFATKMETALGDVLRTGRGITVINAIPLIMELTVHSHAVLIVYKMHVTMRRGSVRMDAELGSTETCVAFSAEGVQKVVTG